MKNLKFSKILLEGLLFAALISAAFKIAMPQFVDSIWIGLVLFFVPGMFIFMMVAAFLKISGVKAIDIAPLASAVIIAVPIFVLTGYDLLITAMLLISGLLAWLLYRITYAALICVSLIFIALVVFGPGEMRTEDRPKLLILALDSMRPSIVDSLVAIGDMPNMEKLIKSGSWGILETEPPIFSPVIWTTIGTGYSKSVHGVKSFHNTSNQVKVPRIWNILEQNGWTAGIYEWLVTWPPEEIDGFMVPDQFSRDRSSFPPGYNNLHHFSKMLKSFREVNLLELSEMAWDVFKSGPRGSTVARQFFKAIKIRENMSDYYTGYIFRRMLRMDLSSEIFLKLAKQIKPDLAIFYERSLDDMGHVMWKFHDPRGFEVSDEEKAKYGSYLGDTYRNMDRIIGVFLQEFGEDINIMIVSDHGMKKIERETQLVYLTNTEKLFSDLGIQGEVYSQKLGIDQFVYPLDDRDIDNFADFMNEHLAELRLSNGNNLFYLEESAGGDYLIRNTYREYGDQPLFFDGDTIPGLTYLQVWDSHLTGHHSLDGSILFRADGIREGFEVSDATIYDIMPTILHWSGLPVAEDMEGKVLTDIFYETGEIEYCQRYEYLNRDTTADEGIVLDEDVIDQLKALGYVK